jgi:ELP3 family radical SAM enzyme/protein acetyltransferase
MVLDIEDLNAKYDGIINTTFKSPTKEDCQKYKFFIDELCRNPVCKLKELKRKYNFNGKNSFIYQMFDMMREDYTNDDEENLRSLLKIKKGKSHSGVLVITIFTSPHPEYYDEERQETIKQSFTCHWNCAYCPNEPGQPRSYLKGEPGVLRANKNEFDCIRQMHDRMKILYLIGHPVDKLEVIVLGGTWTSYPLKYREQFCRDIYYAANIFGKDQIRPKSTLQDEKNINKTASCKVIGLTLETRPDTINNEEIHRLRSYGCTRVQLGIQHIDEDVLEKIKRRCTTKKTMEAIKLLKDTGFKVDAHWMPNLPGTTIEKDRNMFMDQLLGLKKLVKRDYKNNIKYETYDMTNPHLQVDQWKVYPCSIVPWTEIEQWYKEGAYVPYNEHDLFDLIINIKTFVFPWIRLNRIIRDIPTDYIITDNEKPNMRQDAKTVLEKEGKCCMCIRCREVKGENMIDKPIFVVRKYDSSDGIEYFISSETPDTKTLYGFVRLRIPSKPVNDTFTYLNGHAFIRELHVYGQLQEVGKKSDAIQHKGIGRKLVDMAENLAKQHEYYHMAIIAGEGTKGYYEKLGYLEDNREGGFMIKSLII